MRLMAYFLALCLAFSPAYVFAFGRVKITSKVVPGKTTEIQGLVVPETGGSLAGGEKVRGCW